MADKEVDAGQDDPREFREGIRPEIYHGDDLRREQRAALRTPGDGT